MEKLREDQLTVEYIRSRVDEIRAVAGDDEVAHSMEDRLYVSLLQAVADDALYSHDMALLAQEALKVRDIGFCRWYA